jgi:hypothetical protein
VQTLLNQFKQIQSILFALLTAQANAIEPTTFHYFLTRFKNVGMMVWISLIARICLYIHLVIWCFMDPSIWDFYKITRNFLLFILSHFSCNQLLLLDNSNTAHVSTHQLSDSRTFIFCSKWFRKDLKKERKNSSSVCYVLGNGK